MFYSKEFLRFCQVVVRIIVYFVVKNPTSKVGVVIIGYMNFKQQLARAYDKDAERRDKNEKAREQWKLDLRDKFVDLLKQEGKNTILELGSGAGLDAKFFADSGFDVLATDLSEAMIEKCRKRGINAKVVDLYNLDSLGKSFDAVYSMNVLLHVPKKDLGEVLEKICQVLNEKGIFFYGVYGGVDDEEKIITDKTKMAMPRLFSFLSDETLLKMIRDRFEVIEFGKIDIGSKQKDFYFQFLFLRKIKNPTSKVGFPGTN